jgi:hypothetical protein
MASMSVHLFDIKNVSSNMPKIGFFTGYRTMVFPVTPTVSLFLLRQTSALSKRDKSLLHGARTLLSKGALLYRFL